MKVDLVKSYSDYSKNYQKLLKAPYKLIGVISFIVVLITFVLNYALYQIGFEQQKKRLTEVVQSRAAIINEIIKYELENGHDGQYTEKEVMKRLISAHKNFEGFGQTGEYTLAKLENNNIHFLLRHRHKGVDKMKLVPMDSNLAEPMRRALKGEFGNLVGLDYRGKKVLAAHAPIKGLKWGIVAKIDINELESPYVQVGVYGLIGAIIVILIGGAMVVRFIHPLIEEIEESRKYNRMLFESSPIGLALTDFEGNMLDVNPAFLQLVGYTLDEILNLNYWDITPKKYQKQEEEQTKSLAQNGYYGPYEKEYIHKNGYLLNVRLSGSLVQRDGEIFIWSSIENITEQKRNETELKEASLVFEHTHEGIMITDANVKIVRINTPFTRITGYEVDEIVGQNPSFLKSGSHSKEFYDDMWHEIQTKGSWYGELNNRRKNGEYFPTLQSINAVKDEVGNISGYVSVFSDISERKKNEIELTYLATHDALTSLPNRIHFHDTLSEVINTAKRKESKIGVLFLDLNRFKEVNDTIGHEAGDYLLQAVAERVAECLRESDTVARLGGDEFAVILPDIKVAEDAVEVAQKIVERVSEPLNIKGSIVNPSTSIGISIFPLHAQDGDTLLHFADKAMYIAKQKKQNQYELFDFDTVV